jgi:two-component system chemotaxis response regulator CheY
MELCMTINKEMKILVVDDNQGIRKMISDILRAAGFKNTGYAENGKIAWRKINDEPVDLVLLDWDMPVMNGYELLKEIRAQEKFKEMPVLMLTAHAEKKDVLQAIEAGATNYIVKPFAPNTLYRKLKEMLGADVISSPGGAVIRR